MSKILEIENKIKNVVNELGYELDTVTLEKCNMKNLGQFQVNFAMSLAKKYSKNPREIAQNVVDAIQDDFKEASIAGPGFINLTLKDEDLMDNAMREFEFHVDKEEEKTVIVDYGGANAAKALHVGHMRAANIGEALKRLSVLFGNKTIGDVHLGDIGRQAGMLISQLKLEQPDLPIWDENYSGEVPKLNLTAKDLGRMYPEASVAAKADEKRMEEVRQITAEIDKGNNKLYLDLWKQMVEISSESIKEVYNKLNCHFELWEGEMDAMNYVPNVLDVLNPYLYESNGALIMDVQKEDDNTEIPPLMVIKGDGSTIYATRDLGTIYSRMDRFKPDEIWYVVDQRQGLYFEQVFRGSYISGLVPETTLLAHYGFGTINGKDGKPYKTRDGGVMELGTLIELIRDEVESKIKEEITGEEREKIADKLAIATLKYTDLLPYRRTDYIFDPVKFSSLEGKTGPYLLYSAVRMKSLLNKVDSDNVTLKVVANDDVRDILVKIVELSKVLKKAYEERAVNYIADYLYELASLFNKFYNNNNIINEQNEEVKESYIALVKQVYGIVHKLLDVLAIEEVEKM
jgi:arginyl-tRNA synthetase